MRVAARTVGLGALVLLSAVALWRAAAPPAAPVPLPPVKAETASPAEAVLLPDAALPAGAVLLATTVLGRTAPADPAGPGFRHQWPAIEARARFEGDALLVSFDDPVNRFRLHVDAARWTVTRPGRATLRLSGLGPGPHEARLEKLSESPAPATFGGFHLPPGGRPLPAPPAAPRLIAFIGDSDTVGYGNTATSRDCTAEEVFALTDTSQSFAGKLARQMQADLRMTARSGAGLVRNYDGAEPGRTMATLYSRALAEDPGATASAAGPAPQVMVVALGSNDFATPLHAGEAWADPAALQADFAAALLAFLRDRRTEAPDALLILLVFGEYGADLVAAYQNAFDTLQAEGARAALVILPELQRSACHWHPSLADHDLIAARLAEAIAARPDAWGP